MLLLALIFYLKYEAPKDEQNFPMVMELLRAGEVREDNDEYWSWYGFDSRVEWCACFVSWCAEQCGYLESGVIPKFSLCSDGVDWFHARGQFQDASYVPAAGDIIFFDWENDGTIDHVGIVESVTNGVVNTIEGNSGDICARRSYSMGSDVKMGLSYLDMMIIHSPQPWMEVNQSSNRYYEENRQVWKALEAALAAGKVRAIGVSNFLKEDIDSLWEAAEIKPMVNQVLCHISNTPAVLISYCQSKGIVMEAYSPVAHGEALKNEHIKAMAEKYGVSIPQLCIRYDLQLGMIVLPKTANPEHMRTNAEIDFTISDEDMNTLMNMEKIKDYGEYSRFPVFGGRK